MCEKARSVYYLLNKKEIGGIMPPTSDALVSNARMTTQPISISTKMHSIKILRPSTAQVSMYLKRWNSLDNYVLQESSLRKLFAKTYPRNVDMDDVLIKVCSLNDFYSTNIFSPFTVAKHIVDLDIDLRLAMRDLTLVNDIAVVKVNGRKTIHFYSFATKYCSHHFPKDYPIYDSYVEKMLMHLMRVDKFYKFKREDLKHYPAYHDVLMGFSRFYGLESFTLKEIDKYLWQAGKKYFPRQY
jgi:hypothetical protein